MNLLASLSFIPLENTMHVICTKCQKLTSSNSETCEECSRDRRADVIRSQLTMSGGTSRSKLTASKAQAIIRAQKAMAIGGD